MCAINSGLSYPTYLCLWTPIHWSISPAYLGDEEALLVLEAAVRHDAVLQLVIHRHSQVGRNGPGSSGPDSHVQLVLVGRQAGGGRGGVRRRHL